MITTPPLPCRLWPLLLPLSLAWRLASCLLAPFSCLLAPFSCLLAPFRCLLAPFRYLFTCLSGLFTPKYERRLLTQQVSGCQCRDIYMLCT